MGRGRFFKTPNVFIHFLAKVKATSDAQFRSLQSFENMPSIITGL